VRLAAFHWIWLGPLFACCGGEPTPSPGSSTAGASGTGNVGGSSSGGKAGQPGAIVDAAPGLPVDGDTSTGSPDAESGGAGGGSDSGADARSLVGLGTITYERWNGIRGESVALVPVDKMPDVTSELSLFQAPSDVGQDYGARLRGFLTAPASGSYTFWISCDDNGELDLSTDESPSNKKRIAHVTGSPAWTDYVEWNKFPTQKSQAIALVAGARYYVEAVFKEDIAEDHLAVGWLKPGEVGTVPSEIIPGTQLSPATH
jgi:PA14 domain